MVLSVVSLIFLHFSKIVQRFVVAILVMMSELLKIQQDMAAPKKQQGRHKSSADIDDLGLSSDPNDWVADVPKNDIYHSDYTTKQWLQVFKPL